MQAVVARGVCVAGRETQVELAVVPLDAFGFQRSHLRDRVRLQGFAVVEQSDTGPGAADAALKIEHREVSVRRQECVPEVVLPFVVEDPAVYNVEALEGVFAALVGVAAFRQAEACHLPFQGRLK